MESRGIGIFYEIYQNKALKGLLHTKGLILSGNSFGGKILLGRKVEILFLVILLESLRRIYFFCRNKYWTNLSRQWMEKFDWTITWTERILSLRKRRDQTIRTSLFLCSLNKSKHGLSSLLCHKMIMFEFEFLKISNFNFCAKCVASWCCKIVKGGRG